MRPICDNERIVSQKGSSIQGDAAMATIPMMWRTSDARFSTQARRDVEQVWARVLAAQPKLAGTLRVPSARANAAVARAERRPEHGNEPQRNPDPVPTPSMQLSAVSAATPRRKPGRPEALTPSKREYLLQILGLGQ